MKKITTLIVMLVLCAASLFAQAPEKFTYQAVVRNANNTLVANAQVGVRVNILQGTATGNAVYSETHMVSSNANGLVTLNIGAGSVLHGSFANIDWADGPYFLKTDIDPNGGNDYNITSTQQLLSVPYALYAKEAANSFSGDYNDLTNTPQIPTVPTNVSAFSNDAGYITSYTETDPVFNAWDKNYNDLTNRPQIPTVPTNVSAFNNDANYITATQVPSAQVNADWTAVSGAARILNKPTLFSGNYSDLVGKPTNLSQFNNDLGLATVATSGSYNDLNYRPNLATVAITGNYNDLINRPTIPTVPTNVSAFTNDAGYVTSADVQQAAGVPTNVSAFQNDAGYITATQVPAAQVNADWNATSGAARILNKPTLFSGNYNDLTNKPTIPTVPANVSVFNNDAHYITEAQLNALLASMNSTIDSLRDRVEELENGRTPVNPNPETPDTTITPGTSFVVDGLACPGMPNVTDIDGNTYNTVAIGQQCWMKENLRTTKCADGTSISLCTSSSSTNRCRYYPGGSNSNLNAYGYVYNWPAVMYGCQSSTANPSGVQGLCPDGWHVPSNQEWTQLTTYVKGQTDNCCGGDQQSIAKALASTGNWTSNSISCAVGDYAPNNNNTGFSALPAGDHSGNVGVAANYWSSMGANNTAYAIQLTSMSSVVTVNPDAAKENGYSVRCVHNTPIEAGVSQMVTTSNVSDITTTTAICRGTVNSASGFTISERGVCWSQMPNPNVEGSHQAGNSGTGTFSVTITGFQPGTTYYVRAYAMTSTGTAVYGNTQTFTTQPDASACGTATITDYDNNPYSTVKIGEQCWLKENLRTTHYADGTNVNYDTPLAGTTEYGYLYNWLAVMHGASSSSSNPSGIRGICPIGWHVPSNAEWTQLTQYVSSQGSCVCGNSTSSIAKALAAATTSWTASTTECAVGNDPSSNNCTGFSAMPAGYWSSSYILSGSCANFWSSTGSSGGRAFNRYLTHDSASVISGNYTTGTHLSVRCIRN